MFARGNDSNFWQCEERRDGRGEWRRTGLLSDCRSLHRLAGAAVVGVAVRCIGTYYANEKMLHRHRLQCGHQVPTKFLHHFVTGPGALAVALAVAGLEAAISVRAIPTWRLHRSLGV